MVLMENLRDSSDEFGWKYLAGGVFVVVALLFASQSFSEGTSGAHGGETLIQVNLSIDYGADTTSQLVELQNGSTAFQALNQTVSVDFQESSYGYFVTSINNVSQNTTHSWIYLVNGEPPSVAANRFGLTEGDRIRYLYLSNNETGRYFE